MQFLRDLPVARKFVYAFGTVVILCALLGISALVGIGKMNTRTADVVTNAMPSYVVIADLRYQFSSVRRNDAVLATCTTPECISMFETRRQKAIDTYNQLIQKFEPLVSYPGEREMFDALRAGVTRYQAISDRGLAAVQAGNVHEAERLVSDSNSVATYESVMADIDKELDLNLRMATQSGNDSIQAGHSVSLLVWFILPITVLLCIFVGFLLTRMIAPPLIAATEVLERVANKDLTARVEAQSNDEIGRLTRALNTSVDATRDVLGSIATSAETLASAVEELSVRSAQTSANSRTQSGKTNQIAAAAQEMTATIGEISQNAERATTVSRDSAEAAASGGQVMQQASSTMERIGVTTASVTEQMNLLSQSSQEIGRVVTVIQEISEQTNLLALNAAIEAARAGEHGRGFAVVAGEVRRLAERTKSATEEIASTIRSIQEETGRTAQVMSRSREEVESGIVETSNARATLDSIIDKVRNVENMIQLIATAATEQTAASAEISESSTQISHLAGESAAAADEAALASRNLSELASTLDGLIRQFDLGDQKHGARKAPTTSVFARRAA